MFFWKGKTRSRHLEVRQAAATPHQLELRTVLRNSASYLILPIFWFAGLKTSIKPRYRYNDIKATCFDHKVVTFNFMYFYGLNMAIGWGTMLQAGRSSVRFPVVSMNFLIDLFLPAALCSWELTEMSTMNISWGVKAAVTYNLTTFMCRLSLNLGVSTSWKLLGL